MIRATHKKKFPTLFFKIFIILGVTNVAKAQFYTITREMPLEHVSKIKVTETDVNEEIADTSFQVEKKVTEFPRWKYAAARKNRPNRNIDNDLHIRKSKSVESMLPELTIPNLIKEIRFQGIKHEEIVLAQAILETGWFTSSVCRNKNNLFGLTNPRTKQYYEFDHWTESVKAYYTKVQYRYKGGNYLLWLRDIGYAEAPDYVQALVRVIKQLRIKK